MNYLYLILFHCSSLVTGWVITRVFFQSLPRSTTVIRIIGSLLVGILATVTFTYFISTLLSSVHVADPLFVGVVASIAVGIMVSISVRKSFRSIGKIITAGNLSDLLIWFLLVLFSYVLFDKSFSVDSDGTLLVARNAIFDFGHHIGLVRSFSFGENVPFLSPFVAGWVHYYHFLFFFWIGILEHLHIPLSVGMNMASAFGFSTMLFFVYSIGKLLVTKNTWVVGGMAVGLTLTHSTLGFFRYLMDRGVSLSTIKDLWTLPDYPFAGPYDGAVISIHTTLNVFINQRHLSFAIAVFLFLFFIMLAKKSRDLSKMEVIIMGIVTGLLSLWNVFIWGFTLLSFFFFFMLEKNKKNAVLFLLTTIGISFLLILPWFSDISRVLMFAGQTNMLAAKSTQIPFLEQFSKTCIYYWENLSILPFIAAFGFFALPKDVRRYFSLFAIWAFVLFILRATGLLVADQKPYNVWIVGVNLLAAIGIWKLVKKKGAYLVLAIFIFFIVTVSGVMDLMVIKNDYRYPMITKSDQQLISFLKNETPPSTIFFSYADIVDPVAFAGRINYFGYFKSAGTPDRTTSVKKGIEQIQLGVWPTLPDKDISYVVLPRVGRNDFPGFGNTKNFDMRFVRVFVNENWQVYKMLVK